MKSASSIGLCFYRSRKHTLFKKLAEHIEFGDPADDQCAKILPHPYCNFCGKHFFNEVMLQEHLFKEHLNCQICGDDYKHWYYKDYPSLERHFDATHYLCKHKTCIK